MSWQGGLISGAGSLLGSGINALLQDKANKKNYEMQKEFAQNSIQWKVEDAKKAGLHPLAAINAQTYAPTPSYVGADVGSGVSGMSKEFGQALSGYLDDSMTLDNEIRQQELVKAKLENAKLQKELLSMGHSFGGITKNAFGTSDKALEAVANVKAGNSKVPNGVSSDEFVKAFENKARFNLVSNGDGSYSISFSPDMIEGQLMSNDIIGYLIGNIAGFDQMYLNRDLRKQLEYRGKKAGVLKPDEDWNFEWNGAGYTLIPEKVYNRERKKTPPPHKYKSQMMGY